MKRGLIALAIILTVSLIAYGTYSSASRQVTVSKYETGPPDATELLELVNAERAKIGVSPLAPFDAAMKSAQYKADDMVTNDYFGHKAPGTDRNNGLDYLDSLHNGTCLLFSENIAAEMTTSWSAIDTIDGDGWMSSKPHREAILDSRYDLTGFGITEEPNGNYVVVEHFCQAK